MKRAGGVVLAVILTVIELVVLRSRVAPVAESSHQAGASSPATSEGNRSHESESTTRGAPSADNTRTLPPPAFKKAGKVPIGFRRLARARWHVADENYGRWLEEPKDWRGPTPTSVLDLPKTPKIKAQIDELGAQEIDFRLKLLADLDACLKAARIPEGSATVVAFLFDYVDDKTIVANEATLEATTLGKEHEAAFMTCLQKAFVGKSLPMQREPGNHMHAWPTVIPVPTRNHEIFPWLFSEPEPATL